LIDGDMINNVTYIVWHIHILDRKSKISSRVGMGKALQHERVCACGGVVGTLRHGGAQRRKYLEKNIITNHHNVCYHAFSIINI
jgi:hypothetical protein